MLPRGSKQPERAPRRPKRRPRRPKRAPKRPQEGPRPETSSLSLQEAPGRPSTGPQEAPQEAFGGQNHWFHRKFIAHRWSHAWHSVLNGLSSSSQ
eukprot:187591-Pyramimonas_sp.AAC.1